MHFNLRFSCSVLCWSPNQQSLHKAGGTSRALPLPRGTFSGQQGDPVLPSRGAGVEARSVLSSCRAAFDTHPLGSKPLLSTCRLPGCGQEQAAEVIKTQAHAPLDEFMTWRSAGHHGVGGQQPGSLRSPQTPPEPQRLCTYTPHTPPTYTCHTHHTHIPDTHTGPCTHTWSSPLSSGLTAFRAEGPS